MVFTVEEGQCLTTGDFSCLEGKLRNSLKRAEKCVKIGGDETKTCQKDEICETLVEKNQVWRSNFEEVLEVSVQRGCRLRPDVELPAIEHTSVATSISRCSFDQVCSRSKGAFLYLVNLS